MVHCQKYLITQRHCIRKYSPSPIYTVGKFSIFPGGLHHPGKLFNNKKHIYSLTMQEQRLIGLIFKIVLNKYKNIFSQCAVCVFFRLYFPYDDDESAYFARWACV